jgi:hypothetical protein
MNRYAILLGKEPTEQEQKDSLKFNLARSEAMKEEFRKISDQSIFFQEFQYGQRDPRPDITEIIPARNLSPEQAHILTHGLSRLSQEAGIVIMVNNQRIGRVQNWEPSATGRWYEPPGGRAIQHQADIMLRMTQQRILQDIEIDYSSIEQRILEGPSTNGSV